jgi:hypothetical protein
MTHRSLFLLLMLTAMIGASGVGALAQTTGEITGTITNSMGATLAGATVTAHNGDTGVDQEVRTNGSGVYLVSLLQPGKYDIVARQRGFATVLRKSITVQAGQTVRIDFQIPLAAIAAPGNTVGNLQLEPQTPATPVSVAPQTRIALGHVIVQTVTVDTNGASKMIGGAMVRIFGENTSAESFAFSSPEGVVDIPVRPGTYCYEALSNKGESLPLRTLPPSEKLPLRTSPNDRCFPVRSGEVHEVSVEFEQ